MIEYIVYIIKTLKIGLIYAMQSIGPFQQVILKGGEGERYEIKMLHGVW